MEEGLHLLHGRVHPLLERVEVQRGGVEREEEHRLFNFGGGGGMDGGWLSGRSTDQGWGRSSVDSLLKEQQTHDQRTHPHPHYPRTYLQRVGLEVVRLAPELGLDGGRAQRVLPREAPPLVPLVVPVLERLWCRVVFVWGFGWCWCGWTVDKFLHSL